MALSYRKSLKIVDESLHILSILKEADWIRNNWRSLFTYLQLVYIRKKDKKQYLSPEQQLAKPSSSSSSSSTVTTTAQQA